jgi:hypothetical protein
LQTAGDTLENAATAEEIAAAGEALANARIAIIVAGQDLIDASPEIGDDGEMQAIFSEAQDALNDANVVIVIATDTLLSSRIDLPQGNSGNRTSELDKELEESLGVFEGEILAARRAVIDSAPPPTSNDEIPGPVVMGGLGSSGEDEPSSETGMMPSEDIQQGRMQSNEGDIIASTQVNKPPDDIPDAQGDDIVAQQLREAAASEADPELQAKLWEEYKRYKAGL